MISEIDKIKLALSKSNNGTALLFTGAGFSYRAKNVNGSMPKDSRSLSKYICQMADIDEDEDLYYSSEYYLTNFPEHNLIKFLKEEYSISTVSESHELIAKKKWRRIYTTNYDHVFEIASRNIGKVCETINIDSPPSEYTQENQCIHLNGSIESLSNSLIKEQFKLTESSYVSPDTLNNSKWKYKFTIDIENSSNIFFVGYSMYDLDIKRVLKKDFDIKQKTFFIVKPNEDKKEIFKLQQYGTVLDIGIDEFSKLVDEIISDDFFAEAESLECFEKKKNIDRYKEAEGDQTINLFTKGEIVEEEILPSVIGDSLHLIKRDDVEKYAAFVSQGKNVMVTGGIATGKTIFIKQIISLLCYQGKDVFYLANEEGDYKRDISIISSISKNPIIVIDNVFRHEKTIKDLYAFFGERATYLLAGRFDFIEKTKISLKNLDFHSIELNLEGLSSNEVVQINKILNFIGYWGIDSHWSDNKKERYLINKCEGKFPSILIKLFESDDIKSRFDGELSILRNQHNSKEKQIILIVTILGLLPFNPRKSLVSDLCGNDDYVFTHDFTNNPVTKHIISFSGSSIGIKSGILAKYILSKYYSGGEIVEKLIQIIIYFNQIRNDSLMNEVFKELLRFKNVNYMLPDILDKSKGKNLNKFFGDIKLVIRWLEKSPHFWLQYAMAQMFLEKFDLAKQYLDNAKGRATDNSYYDTKYIDNQIARWHLESVTIGKALNVYEHFESAYRILMSQELDSYVCKQMLLFGDLYKHYFSTFSKANKVDFEKKCKSALEKLNKSELKEDVFYKCQDVLNEIINQIKP